MFARSCTGRAGQRWSVYPDRTLRTEGGCLDVAGAGKASGTPVDWYPCNGTAAQDWTHAAHGGLVNPVPACASPIPAAGRGSRLDIETCTGSAAAALDPAAPLTPGAGPAAASPPSLQS